MIFALIGKLAQLHAMDLGADERRDLIDIGLALREQVGERRIRIFSMIVMLEWLERGISTFGEP